MGSTFKRKSFHIYYVLALLNIISMLAALALTQQLKHEYELAVIENKRLSSVLTEFRKLNFILSALNVPGNRLFESHNLSIEKEAFNRTKVWYLTAENHASQTVNSALQNSYLSEVTPYMHALKNSVRELIREAENVFIYYEQQEMTVAASRMARMDSHFSTAIEAIADVSEFIGVLQDQRFEQQAAIAISVEQHQYIIIALVFLIMFMIVLYGRFLSNQQQKQHEELNLALKNAEAGAVAKERFLATISHEIRTPMNGIKGMLDLISQDNLSEESKTYLGYAKQSADNLLHTVNDVLNISKLDADKVAIEIRPINLTKLLDQISSLAKISNKKSDVDIVLDTTELEVEAALGDEHRITQILNNLIGNAIKFTEHGQITIEVKSFWQQDQIRLVCNIKDTGIGIPADKLDHVFEVFTQADVSTTRKYGGTGLGLSISKKLANRLGGDISVESEVGVGSTFCFDCLLQASSQSKVKSNDNKHDNDLLEITLFDSINVLVAEDEKVNQILVQAILNKLKCTFHIVENGQEVLNELDNNQSYDVILMDCQMPILDGYETTRAIRQRTDHYQAIPIFAVTANALPEDREKCLSAGMNEYITKPIDIPALKRLLINKVLNS